MYQHIPTKIFFFVVVVVKCLAAGCVLIRSMAREIVRVESVWNSFTFFNNQLRIVL